MQDDSQTFIKILPFYSEVPHNCSEIDILSRFKHPNMISLTEICKKEDKPDELYLTFRRAQLTLYSVMASPFNETERMSIVKKIIEAVRYLHSQYVLHLDIKPENVVIMDGEPQLIDYGSSRTAYTLECALPKSALGALYITPEYGPPELGNGGDYNLYGWFTDVWSLAIFVAAVMTSSRFYPNHVRMNNYPSIHSFITVNLKSYLQRLSYIMSVLQRTMQYSRNTQNLAYALTEMTSYSANTRCRIQDVAKHFSCTVQHNTKAVVYERVNESTLLPECEKYIKEICLFFVKFLTRYPTQALFLAVDLFVRSCHIVEEGSAKNLVCACIGIAISSVCRLRECIRTTLTKHFESNMSLVRDVIVNLKGVIEPPFLFAVHRSPEHLSFMVRHYFSDISRYISAVPAEEMNRVNFRPRRIISTVADLNLSDLK